MNKRILLCSVKLRKFPNYTKEAHEEKNSRFWIVKVAIQNKL